MKTVNEPRTGYFHSVSAVLPSRDYDPELATRVGLGRTSTVYVQVFTGTSFYFAVFRSADRPGEVYLESGLTTWNDPTQIEDDRL